MKDFLAREDSITQDYLEEYDKLFRKVRYGISSCSQELCTELILIRWDLLKWQKTNDCFTLGPVVDAGINKKIKLPWTYATLWGSFYGPYGAESILWEYVSGPTTPTFEDASSLKTIVSGLALGEYVFKLSVTDTNETTVEDEMIILVREAVIPPSESAYIYWGYFVSDPLSTIEASGTTALQFSLQTSDFIIYNNLDFTNTADTKFLVVKEPVTSPVKTLWRNTSFNYGTIPDQVFRDAVVTGDFRYYISREIVNIPQNSTLLTFQ